MRFSKGRSCLVLVAAWALAAPRARGDEQPISDPVPIERAEAIYPAGGTTSADVTLAVEIGLDGEVGATEVVASGGASFDEAAIAAAKRWRFQPATLRGRPVRTRIRLTFHFDAPLPPTVRPIAPNGANGPQTPNAQLPNAQTPSSPQTPNPQLPNAQTPNSPQTPGAQAPNAPSPNPPPDPAPSAPSATEKPIEPVEVRVPGKRPPPIRSASDVPIELKHLAQVPQSSSAGFLRIAPGIMLSNEGGEGHAEQVFLRGFDAREGQDIEFSVDGMPINEAGNLHGNGYSDTHFIIPELVQSLRVTEGPYDPRQGNFAVAGSADYHLGLVERGMTAKLSIGNFGTYRMLLLYGPPNASEGTFAGVELYQTDGYGQNRDGRRGSAMAQYEGGSGSTHYRVFAQAYASSFHTAGVLREDDVASGKKGFYDTYDPLQGEDASRYSVSLEVVHKSESFVVENLVYAIARPLRLRENFTGFLLDVQEPLQSPHGQRGDLIDLQVMEATFGLRGSARTATEIAHQRQEIEVGYFARGDFGSGVQQRIEAATGHPYHTDTNLDYRLGDIGLYADLNLRLVRWLALRGGVRGDLFTYDVHDNCAVQSVEHPDPTRPTNDASCLDQENFGAHREPDQTASTQSIAILPRASLLVGPFWGLTGALSAGKGVRSIDPIYVSQDAKTPFASANEFDAGILWTRRLADSIDVTLRSTVLYTKIDKDLIFSQTAGRNTLAGPTTRVGSASMLRLTGPFYDLAANFTYVKATFDDTGLLVPYIPDTVFRVDSALFGALPWKWARIREKPIYAVLAAGLSYVGPRALPYGSRSDTIFTIDANATLSWWLFEVGVSAMNLLNSQYRLGEYNYASDFHSQPFATLVPVRSFSAGAPLTVLGTFAIHFGDRK